MKRISKRDLNKAISNFKKLPRLLADNAFLTFWASLVLCLVIGGVIFYQYSIWAEPSAGPVGLKSIQFKEKTYQTILQEWQKRNESFLEAERKSYLDPF